MSVLLAVNAELPCAPFEIALLNIEGTKIAVIAKTPPVTRAMMPHICSLAAVCFASLII